MDERNLLIPAFLRYLWVFLIVGLAACIPAEKTDAAENWLPSQVRTLDPAESTPNPYARIDPSQDLIALYSRETRNELQVRLDFLDLKLNTFAGLPLNPSNDLYLAIDFVAGNPSSNWDLLITIPAEGNPQASFSQQSSRVDTPIVQFDTLLDSLTVSIDREVLPNLRPGYSLHAFLTGAGSQEILDEISIVKSTESVDPIPLLLTFWNAMPAHTPAQALRRWDGAHTGPLGERHGLKHLLEASRENQITVVLLDLKTSSSLSAIDLLGQTQNIAFLQRSGYLILPECLPETYFGDLPAESIQHAVQTNRQNALNFGLMGSPFLYVPSKTTHTISNYNLIFLRQPVPVDGSYLTTRNISEQGQHLLSLPDNHTDTQQATDQGLEIDTLRLLLQMALSEHPADQVAVLGGDLSRSTFGDPQAAHASLKYIAEHPWMQILSRDELQTLPACSNCTITELEIASPVKNPTFTALQNVPPNTITQLAWQMFFDLSTSAIPKISELAALRASYLGDIGNLLAAAKWNAQRNNNSGSLSMRNSASVDCTTDTDFDGRIECQLSAGDYFALVDPDGGRLALLFSGPTQLVGASSQFVVGLSDHQMWDLEAGPLADPANIPGALAGPWSPYEILPLSEGVKLTTTGVEKIFRLSEKGLRVDLNSDQPLQYQIPLAVAPESRFYAGWADQYQASEIHQGWVWGIAKGPKVEIHTSADLSGISFLDSKPLILLPENPNLGYPAGHFLPFPLAVVNLFPQANYWVEISLFANQPPDQ